MFASIPAVVSRTLVALLLLAFAAACASRGMNPDTAAVVNGVEIPLSRVEERIERAMSNEQIVQQIEGNEDARRQLETQILNQMVELILIDQAAQELGVSATDEEVQARLDQLIEEELGGQAQYQEFLASQGLIEEEIFTQVRSVLLGEKMQERVGAGIDASDVSDEEVDSSYTEEFDGGEPVARHILVNSREEAKAAKERIDGGEDFATVAMELSLDRATAVAGGMVGEVVPGEMVAPFEEAVMDAEEGEVVGPVQTDFGFHVIERLPSPPPHAIVDDGLRQQLVEQERNAAFEAFAAEQREKAEVQVNPRFGRWDPEIGQVVSADPLGDLQSDSGQQEAPAPTDQSGG